MKTMMNEVDETLNKTFRRKFEKHIFQAVKKDCALLKFETWQSALQNIYDTAQVCEHLREAYPGAHLIATMTIHLALQGDEDSMKEVVNAVKNASGVEYNACLHEQNKVPF